VRVDGLAVGALSIHVRAKFLDSIMFSSQCRADRNPPQEPPNLARRGGVWFRGGNLRLHLGVDRDFHPAGKAHPAILVRGLTELAARCRAAGFPPVTDEPLAGFDRVYVFDPFGNRIELLEPVSA